MSEDFFSTDLMTAYSALGRIIGEAVEDDLVEEIFSKFCLGKQCSTKQSNLGNTL